jgi:hypothetical protein
MGLQKTNPREIPKSMGLQKPLGHPRERPKSTGLKKPLCHPWERAKLCLPLRQN